MTVLVHVNDHAYAEDDEGLAVVESLILAAVREGGAFLELHDNGARPVRVLVTPSSSVRIEKVPQPVVPSDGDELFPDFAFFDLEI
jgi:hypothetical protein